MKPNCWKRVSASALVLILMMAPGWAKTLTVSNNRDRGEGTLRQAILDANASPGQNTIVFAIAGPGLKTIAPQSPLPPITGSTVVDGTTQQGYTDSPLIEVSGALLDVSGTDGIQLRAPGAGVRGLAVTRFGGSGISVRATGCTVERNFIGTAGGYADARGNAVGVWLEAANNTSVRANLISGNSLGVYVHATTGARIEANDVGTDSSGLFPLSNEVGILCEDSQSLQIVNNLVSGNWDRGIVLGPGTTSSRVSDNLVGAGVTWDPLGNGTDGISIEDASSCVVENNTAFANWNSAIRLVGSECRTNSVFGNLILGNGVGIDIDHGASSNIIGENAQTGNYISGNLSEGIRISGSGTGGNLIAGNQILTNGQNGVLALATENEVRNNWISENGTNGVVVGLSATGIPAERVRITGNAIAQNGDLGIRLVSGTTSGGNALQPAPRLSIVSGISGQITVIGSLLAAPNTTYRIEYFRNAVPDASGTGEGESLIGSSTMTTGLHGQGYFTAVLATLSSGQFVTATATDPSGNTSAFSNAIPYTGASDLVITGLSPGSVRRGGPAFTLTVTGSGFTSGCFVRWNGARRQTTFISSTQLTTTISAGDLVGAGQFMVGVETPGGSRSNDLPFFVINPVPVLNSITPEMVMRNAASFTLAADGADFVRESVILWNDKPMTTAYVSPTRLLAKIEPANLGTAQTVTIKVFTAPPYGGTSAGKVLTIANPAPVVTSIAPSFAVAEGKGFLLTVYGQGFVRESEIQWNTESRITTFVSDKELRTTVKAEDITTVGNASVGVVTPPPGGGASAPLNFAIVKDSTAPDTVIVEGPNQNGVACEKNVRFLVTGSDDTTDTPDLRYKYRVDAGAWQDAISVTTINLTDLADGAHVFEVAAVDKAGNVDSTPAKRTFSVYSTYLMISNKKISPVTISSAPVSWTTNNPSTSEVRWGRTETYEQTPVTNGSYVTSHTLTLTGLSSSTTYHVRIVSTDECGRTNQSNDIEFTTPDAPDLVITLVTPPGPALVGDQAVFQWTGKNIGKKTATGKWSDSVYLSTDKKWDIDDARLGRVDHTGDIAVGSTYTNQFTAEIPPLTPGNYYVIVRADIGGEVEEAEEWNNDGASIGTMGIDVQEIQVGQVVNGTLSTGTERYFKFRPPAGETVRVSVSWPSSSTKIESYARFAQFVTRSDFDELHDLTEPTRRDLTIAETQNGWYYVLVYGSSAGSAGSSFSLQAEVLPFVFTEVTPRRIGDTGQVTLTLRGAQFSGNVEITLLKGSTELKPYKTWLVDRATLKARFQMNGAEHGNYTPILKNGDGMQLTIPDKIVIETADHIGGPNRLDLTTTASTSPRVGTPYTVDCSVSSRYNTDVEYVIVSMAFKGPVAISAKRPSDAIPRVSDDLLVSNIAGSNTDDTTGTIILRDIAPGEKVRFRIDVTNPTAGAHTPIKGVIQCQAYPDWAFVYLVRELNEYMRLALRETTPNWPAESLAKLENKELFWEYMEPLWQASGFIAAKPYYSNEAIGIRNNNSTHRYSLNASESECLKCYQDCSVGGWKCAGDWKEILISCAAPAGFLIAIPGVADEIAGCVIAVLVYEFSCAWEEGVCRDSWCKYVCPPNPPGPPPQPGPTPDPGSGCTQAQKPTPTPSASSGACDDWQTPNDPNDVQGPAGFGESRYIKAAIPMGYTINFENIPPEDDPDPDKLAAAALIKVTHRIDDDLDLSTLRFGEMAFGKYRITVPEGRRAFSTRIQLGPDLGNLLADLRAEIDDVTRIVTWTLKAIDPDTGEIPNSALLGLLPPNDETHRGQGYVTYTIEQKPGLETGTKITSEASIVFDFNDPVVTPVFENTIDADAPETAVKKLADRAEVSTFTVSWDGTDQGSGIGYYDIYVSQDGQPYVLWLNQTKDTTREFSGQWGSTYRFYSVARDNVGNVESAPTTPDAVTTVATLVPQVTATLPNAAASGGPGFPLRVNGKYFTPKSVARWNGSNLVTTYVSDSQLTAEVPQALIATAGRADISVVTPPPGGGTSNSVSFVVTAVQPFAAFAHDASIPGKVTLNALPNGTTLIDAQAVLRYDPTQMDTIAAGDITPLGSWSVVDFSSENGFAVVSLAQLAGPGQAQPGPMLALATRPVAGAAALTAPVLTLAGGSFLTDQSSKSYPVNDSVTLLPGRTRQLSGRIIGTPSAGFILNEKVIAVEAGNFLHVMKASDLTDVPTFLPIDLGAPVKGRVTFGVVGGRPVFSAGTSHGFLRVFDAVTGIPVQIGAANPLGSAIDTAPAIDNATGDVYVGVDRYNGGNRAALIRFHAGTAVVALLDGDRVTGSPAVYGSYAVVGTNKGVQLLRIEDGGFIPQASIPVTNINTAAIISTSANALVSRTNDAGTAVLMQLNLITGQPAQQTLPLGPSSGPLSQGFGYAPVTYGGNDGALYRIQSGPTGPVLAGTVSPFLGPISPQPIVIGGVTYAVDNDGNFRSTAGASFNINWRPTNAIAATGVTSGSDSLLLATQEGVVISMPF